MKKCIDRQTFHLFLDGELDLNNADQLRKEIDQEIDRRKINMLILHMDQVKFIDSSGLGVILGRYKKLKLTGGKVIIADVPAHLYKIMELSGLPKIIEFVP